MIEVFVRQADRQTIGSFTEFDRHTLTQRRNDAGRWVFQISDPDIAEELTPRTNSAGAITSRRGVIIRKDGHYLDSGWCKKPDAEEVNGVRTWTFSGFTDTAILANALCYPSPQTAITNSVTTQPDRDYVVTGSRSARVRELFLRNVVERMAEDGADAGALVNIGPTDTSRARFTTLLTLAQEICGRSVNFSVSQRDTDRQLLLAFRAPRDLTQSVQFSEGADTIDRWGYSSEPATVTRVVIAVGGEGVARRFRLRINAEAELAGDTIERFLDARDIDPLVSGWEAEADARGDEFLSENAGSTTFSIDATGGPKYGAGPDQFLAGDMVRCVLANGVTVDDLVEETVLEVAPGTGERVTVQVGPADPPEKRDAKRERDTNRRIKALEARL